MDPLEWRVVSWLAERRGRMTSDSLSQVLSRMRTTADIFTPTVASLLRAPLVAAALEGMRRVDGPVPLVRGAVPLTIGSYARMRDAAEGEARAVAILAWHAAMRFADVAAVRGGGMWSEGDVVVVELPVSKTQAVGLPRGVRFVPPPLERRLLRPWLSVGPPTSRPFERPPMFNIGYAAFADAVRRLAGAAYTPHSFRKGAVQHLLRRGGRVQDIPLLTLHRSLPGLLAYANVPDAETQATVRALSSMLAH
ncbi:MAG: site-specific integrase [Myxococcaceae bacterium]|nr:MAG: site-specific integrase [Myxococcaceae bacterium]